MIPQPIHARSHLALLFVLLALLLFSFAPAQASAEPPHSHETHHHHDQEEHAHDHGAHHHDEHHHDDHGAHEHEHEDHDHHHDDHHDHHHDNDYEHHASGPMGTRLVVAEHDTGTLHVIELGSGDIIASFHTPGAVTSLYASPSRQHAIALHRDANRVSIIHSGLTAADHGDHVDLLMNNPYVLSTMNVGRQPSHFWSGSNQIAIFNDEDGTIALLDERLFGLSLDFTQIVTEGPDHGAAVVLGDHLLSGYLHLGRVDVYARNGARMGTLEEPCPRLHGQATLENVAVFGCTDGVLVVRLEDGELSASKIANPALSPEGARVGTLASHPNNARMLGNFGQGLALIDLDAETFEVLELPANPVRFSFDHDGAHALVLTADGGLHLIDPMTGEVEASLELIPGLALEPGAPRPGLAVIDDYVYVSVPEGGEVLEVHLHDFELERRLAVPGVPTLLAAVFIEGATLH